jgi:hypothetical protein
LLRASRRASIVLTSRVPPSAFGFRSLMISSARNKTHADDAKKFRSKMPYLKSKRAIHPSGMERGQQPVRCCPCRGVRTIAWNQCRRAHLAMGYRMPNAPKWYSEGMAASASTRTGPFLLKSAFGSRKRTELVKDFSNASFSPDTIAIMKDAMDAAVASLPDPVNSSHVQSIAETILRTANEGERDPTTLRRMALLELQITPRD